MESTISERGIATILAHWSTGLRSYKINGLALTLSYMNKAFRLPTLLLLCLWACTTLSAQNTAGTASISGSVVDESGAAVAGAKVLVENTANGLRRELTTNAAGVFSAPALIPGAGYKVSVSQAGFANYARAEIGLTVGLSLNLPIRLQVASAATILDVSTELPLVESSKTDVSQLIDSKQILELPINGRRVDAFVLLTPAVVPDGTFGLISFRGVSGHNSFLTDGNDTTNQFYNENAGRTRIASQISQDAVQEFQVISNNPTAEYGRAMGGVVNTVTRSGGNEIHGTAFWFFRNRTLNARDGYASFNPPEVRHQTGGTVGGPIKKDKLFYFLNFEATRRKFPLLASVTAAPLFNANGVFQDFLPNGQPQCAAPATAAQCASAKNFVTTRNFGTVNRTANSEVALGKIDYRPNERNSLSFSMNYVRWISPNGIQTQAVLNNGNGIGNNADSTVRTRYGRAVWTFIPNSSSLNEARFGWFKDRLFDDASADFLRPELGRAGLTVNGVSNLGYATGYPRLNPSEQRFSFADSFSKTAGRHSMKAGIDFASTQDYQNQLSNQYGTYSYATFTNFALDFTGNGTLQAKNWNTYGQGFGNPIVDITVKDLSWYAQDQYRITPKLILNYGVRWDYAMIPQPTLVNPDYDQSGKIPSPKTNFAPRVGLAYTMFGGKTVLRAGYGIFFARYQTGLINTLFINNNVYQRFLTLQATTAADKALGPIFPNNLAALDRNPPPGTTSVSLADRNLRNPYTQQGNLGIEHQLSGKMSLSVSYLWSRGVRLYTVRDLNAGPLGADVTYQILDANKAVTGTYSTPAYRGPRADPRYQRVNQIENGGLSYYDGLAVQFNRRMSKGFQAGVSYTWSHAIDLFAGGGNNTIFFSGGPTSYYNGNYSNEKGSSANDTRHRAAINFLWEPQWGMKSSSAFVKHVLAGWQLSQITTLQTGQPATAFVSVSGAAFTGALFNASLNGLGGSNRVPFLPINNLQVDPVLRADARVSKTFSFTERKRLSLYFEAFNLSNSQYDTSIRTTQYTVATGSQQLVPAVGFGTGSASQGFPDGTNARRAQVGVRFAF